MLSSDILCKVVERIPKVVPISQYDDFELLVFVHYECFLTQLWTTYTTLDDLHDFRQCVITIKFIIMAFHPGKDTALAQKVKISWLIGNLF